MGIINDNFIISLNFEDASWEFKVRQQHSRDLRFHAIITSEEDRDVSFQIMRSASAQWIFKGKSLPVKLLKHGQDIGQAFEMQSTLRYT